MFIWLQRKKMHRITLWLRAISMIFLILALAQPKFIKRDNSMDVIFALDISQSISPQSKEEGLQFIRDAIVSKREADRAGFVVFGEEAFTQSPPDFNPSLDIISSPSLNGTNIEKAIELSNVLLSQSTRNNKRLVLITDGNETDGSAINSAYSSR